MYNYNSPIIQNMMQNGQLQQSYNPYNNTGMNNIPQQQLPYQPEPQYNNMVPFGYNGYNQQMPQQYYPYQGFYGVQQPQQQSNGYVFRPVAGGYDYGYQQQQIPYYYQYQNIDPFLLATMDKDGNIVYNRGPVQASQIAEIKQTSIEMNKLKARQCAKYFGMEVDEDELDRKFNPDHPENKRINAQYNSPELQELKKMQQLTNLIEHPVMETEAMMTARVIHDMSANFHKEYDGMGLCEFLEDHLWKFQREWWIRDNVDTTSSRNLSKTYSQNPYRELLNMHRSSNPYINDLLSNSKYDNNIDDMEIGMPSVLLTAEQRRKQILEGPVPQFISSPEVQKQRNEFFNKLTGMVAAKQQGAVNYV